MPAPSELGTLQWVCGRDVEGCGTCELFSVFVVRITTEVLNTLCDSPVSSNPPAFILGQDIAGNCPVFFTPAQITAGSVTVLDTPSIDLTITPGGQISADIIDQYVRNLFCAISTATVDMTYSPLTGCFSAVIDPGAIVGGALCAALSALPLASFIYGVTALAGTDCNAYTVPAQTLVFDNFTRLLTITDGNTVLIPDLHIVSFTIAGNIATITRSDGVVFTQAIPLTLDINVASFTLSGGVLTITETDGSVHNITLPQDCCPTSFTLVGNNLVLTLSDGTVFTVPLPVEVTIASVVVSGSVLTITETNGTIWTANLPVYNVTSGDGSVTVVTTLGPGNLTTFDLSVNFPPPGAIICAQVIACLGEGRNIDIQPTGVINAGFLRSDGAGCYTWINQDGVAIFSFCLPAPFNLCASIAGLAIGAPVGAGQSINVLGADCLIHQINIPSPGLPFNLCASLAALPAGTGVGAGGSLVVLDPDTCQRRLVTIPPVFDLCAGLNAIQAASLTTWNFGTHQIIGVNSGLFCHGLLVGFSALCARPTYLLGTDFTDDALRYAWADIESISNALYAEAAAVSVTPGVGAGGAVLAQAVGLVLNNTHNCRNMSYQAVLRSGRTEFFYGAAQAAYTQQRKDVQFTGPNTAGGTMYYTNQVAPPNLCGLAQYPADSWVSAGIIPPLGAVAFTMNILAWYANALGGAAPALAVGTGMAFGRSQMTLIGVSQ